MKKIEVKKETETRKGKTFVGKVVSINMKDTIIVELSFSHAHELYKKQIQKTKRVAVYGDHTDVKIGQFVEILETRPLSKTVHFRVLRGVKK